MPCDRFRYWGWLCGQEVLLCRLISTDPEAEGFRRKEAG